MPAKRFFPPTNQNIEKTSENQSRICGKRVVLGLLRSDLLETLQIVNCFVRIV